MDMKLASMPAVSSLIGADADRPVLRGAARARDFNTAKGVGNFSRVAMAVCAWGVVCMAAPAMSQTVTEFPISASGQPAGIVTGPDGNLWFAEYSGNKIAHTTLGGIIEFSIPTTRSEPFGIVFGPDGNLWFAEGFGNKIGRVTTAGLFAEFQLPTAFSAPEGIAAGPDGALWFSEDNNNKIGRITTAGAITEFTLPSGANALCIAAGPDGAMWFTDWNDNKIGRITMAGDITEFPIPTANAHPIGIAAGPDGALWFTESGANKIGRITTAGAITEFPIPTASSLVSQIWPGPDGALWFTESNTNKIGRITLAGVITEYPIPTASSDPYYITVGPDGAMWFTEFQSSKLGRITVPANPTPVVTGMSSRKVHGGAGTFDLPLSAVATNPTTEPRQGPTQTIVFTFNKPINAATATITEGTATVGTVTFSGDDVIVPLGSVNNQQYVTVGLTNVGSTDGGTGGTASVRVGFLLADVNQNRVVSLADLGVVNAQLAQTVTAANYLKDVNANGTLTVADKGIVNANLTHALPAP
jgi:streptogramin lyase